MLDDLMTKINGKWICNACNVLPTFLGEHRCFRSDAGRPCECQEPLCRMSRGEATLEETLEDGTLEHLEPISVEEYDNPVDSSLTKFSEVGPVEWEIRYTIPGTRYERTFTTDDACVVARYRSWSEVDASISKVVHGVN